MKLFISLKGLRKTSSGGATGSSTIAVGQTENGAPALQVMTLGGFSAADLSRVFFNWICDFSNLDNRRLQLAGTESGNGQGTGKDRGLERDRKEQKGSGWPEKGQVAVKGEVTGK